MPRQTNNSTEKPIQGISDKELLDAIEQIDWEEHWRKVTGIMSEEAAAYERARAKSMEGAAQKVFL